MLKKAFALLVSVLLVTFVIFSAHLTSETLSRSGTADTSSSNNNQKVPNSEITKPEARQPEVANIAGNPKEPCASGNTNSAGARNDPTENHAAPAPDQTPDSHAKTGQDQNPASGVIPPDGRIYLTSEDPCPYLPTCTPKGSRNIPIVPLEPNN